MGCHKPSQLLSNLSSYDIAMWQAYDTLFPFGQFHTDYLLAQLTSVMFNLLKAKEVQPITPDEFLGKNQTLSEEYVTATLRAFKGS